MADSFLDEYLVDLGFSPLERPKAAEVKKKWRELCKKHHPDRGGEEKEFQRVTHAYKMLTDPNYRSNEMKRKVREEDGNLKGDLNISIQAPINFEDAFFGRKMAITFSPNELDKDFEYVEKEDADLCTISVTIPPGSTDGFSHMAEGKGNKMGEIRGDTQIFFMVKPHPKLQVHGMTVDSVERVPMHLLLKGGVVSVQTMYGIKSLKIPAGTQPRDKLKIPKCGVREVGNHYVTVDPIFPSKEDLKKDDWKGLDIDWSIVDEEDEMDERILNMFNVGGGYRRNYDVKRSTDRSY